MGQEVKNPLRAQSKYSLMGSSAKTGKFFFQGSPEHFLRKNAIWDRTPPHLHINCSLHVCMRAQGSQIFKQNSIISIRSKVMAFLVILLSPWSPRCPCGPHIIPVVSVSSPCHPHIVPIAPRRSPCGPNGLWSPWSPHVSVVSTCCPRVPHIVPIIPMSSPSSPHHPHSPQKVTMWFLWSVVSVVPTCCPCGLHMLSPSFPHRPCHPHIVPVVPTSSRRPHVILNPPDTHFTHPCPPGVGGPKSVKIQ